MNGLLNKEEWGDSVMEMTEGVSILMPCLNEAKTIESCVYQAVEFLQRYNINGEVLVVDNASTDFSGELAQNAGARVVTAGIQGYGSALQEGIRAAGYKYILMLDADDSYDVFDGKVMLDKLEEGYDLVIGNRFAGELEKGAMPWLHRYLGNPLLSALGRRWSGATVKDFHCGIRAFKKEAIEQLGLETTRMEFASEMIMKAAARKLKITETPCRLRKDGRNGKSHLRTVRDGIRHVVCMWENRNKSK